MQDIQRVQNESQIRVVVEEPSEAVMPSEEEFPGPQIFGNVPRNEWHPEVHVRALDEEARQCIVVMGRLLHRFVVRTEAHE